MSRPLRILQVVDFYRPRIGGMEQHVEMLSQSLVQRGHEVAVATIRLPGTILDEMAGGVRIQRINGWYNQMLAGSYQRSNAPYHPPVADPGTVTALRRIIDRMRPDIVHAQGWITYSCLAAASRRRFPLVVTLHDHGFVCARRTMMRDGRVPCPGPRFDNCLRCASGQYGTVKGTAVVVGLRASRPWHSRVDSWIANSEFVAHTSRCALPRDCDISVIPPASAHPPALKQLPPWLPAAGYLLFVGALSGHKGLHWLLDAYSDGQISRPLVILGVPNADTPSSWPADVIVRENVPHDQVMEAWRHAGIGLVPSMCQEGFGLVAVEAMRSAVPVVASRIGALPEIVTDGVTGILVSPGDTDGLRKAIRRLDADPACRQMMGTAGAVRARQFSAEAVTLSHEQLYYRLLNDLSTL